MLPAYLLMESYNDPTIVKWYHCKTIEDVKECLKNAPEGRQGVYVYELDFVHYDWEK